MKRTKLKHPQFKVQKKLLKSIFHCESFILDATHTFFRYRGHFYLFYLLITIGLQIIF